MNIYLISLGGEFEKYAAEATDQIFKDNRKELIEAVEQVVAKVRERKNGGTDNA